MVLGLIKLLGIVLFLYLVWRNLNDDYRDEHLISYGWSSIMVMLLGGRIVYGLWNWGALNDSWTSWLMVWKTSGFNYYGGVMFVLLWTWWFCLKNEWKLWSFLEDVTPIYYLLLAFLSGGEYIQRGLDFRLLVWMIVFVIGYLLANFLKGNYRSISWYRSGKKGFIFFATNLVMGLVATVISFLFKDGLFLIILYLGLSLIFGVGLVILGETYGTKK
ncbi:prolipoprotein diacylglyceryl transferase [Candidatus Shapirobacteria bacterium]|nr:prolipoprotein diacylglyceryl transferase [Candidatus Shapirobacteria bacterium]